MNIVNLTPHTINIRKTDGAFLNIPASGAIARREETRETLSGLDGIGISRASYGAVTGLPDPQDNTIYVVSALVLSAPEVAGRTDVFAPGQLIRGDNGQPIGCDGLSAVPQMVQEFPDWLLETIASIEHEATQSYGYGSLFGDYALSLKGRKLDRDYSGLNANEKRLAQAASDKVWAKTMNGAQVR